MFQHCFVNVEATSINVRNVRRLNFHFQRNTNVEITLMNVDDQRRFNLDSRLMCVLDRILSNTYDPSLLKNWPTAKSLFDKIINTFLIQQYHKISYEIFSFITHWAKIVNPTWTLCLFSEKIERNVKYWFGFEHVF